MSMYAMSIYVFVSERTCSKDWQKQMLTKAARIKLLKTYIKYLDENLPFENCLC